MKLCHTLLFMLRPQKLAEDLALATSCLRSLEKSSHKTLVAYNQGPLPNENLEIYLRQFELDCRIVGEAANVGIAAGRQNCFRYVWDNFPDADFLSELHLDMLFASGWEDPLTEYLDHNEDPVISAGIVDKNGSMPFLDRETRALPDLQTDADGFLKSLRRDRIVHGFTHPCVHRQAVLREVGGYDTHFLPGRQCFEDDSLLLGYYYYLGTRADWRPKVNFNSVVYHAVGLQRMDLHDSIMPNYNGLVRQYGAAGLKSLSRLHASPWHRRFFTDKYNSMLG